jgi:hypothetical protein
MRHRRHSERTIMESFWDTLFAAALGVAGAALLVIWITR